MHLSVINPFALFPEVAAAPSGGKTTVEGGLLAAQREPILQTECPWLGRAVCAWRLERASRLGLPFRPD